MEKPLVSIIVPSYNAIEFIEATLDSILKQTYSPIETIIIDDHSTDGTYEFLRERFPDSVTLTSNPKKGACSARNHGITVAKGKYIQFLDADDLLSPNKISSQVLLLNSSRMHVAVCKTNHFQKSVDESHNSDSEFLIDTDCPAEFLLNLYGKDGKNFEMIAQHAWLTPKSVIDKAGLWDENLKKDQDGEFFARVLMKSSGVAVAHDCSVYYRRHINGQNVSGNRNRQQVESQLKATDSKARQLEAFKDSENYKKAFALQYKNVAIEAWPQFKGLAAEALQKSSKLGGSDYSPVLGGKLIESIKQVFGWKVAKSFSHWIHSNETIKKLRNKPIN